MVDARPPSSKGPSWRVSRRGLLRASGAAAAGMAAPAWLGRAAASQATASPEAATPVPRLGDAAWNDLAKRLQGRLLRPGDDMYAPATVINATRYMKTLPAGIAVCQSPQDAATCVNWARETGAPFAVRSGGHNYAGFSTSDGLVIDVRGMQQVTVDRAAGTVVVTAGVNNAEIGAALTPYGVYFPGGRCPTVGVSGLTLGGGWGFSCRHLGLTCDSLLETELVTASGELVTASEQEHPDLFWAVRGGAGGNFGVHTSFKYRVVPTMDVTVLQLAWSGGETAALLDALLRLQSAGPRELGLRIGAGSQSRTPLTKPAPIDVSVIGLYWGSAAETEDLLAPVEQIQKPVTRTVNEVSFAVGREFLSDTTPIGTYQIKSAYIERTLPPQGIATMLDWIGKRPGYPARLPEAAVAIYGWGGKVKDVAPDATAFVHRKEDLLLGCLATWEPTDDPGLIAANLAWLDHFYAAMQPYCSGGSYQNFADRGLANWQQAYYGQNLARLETVKRAWDPNNLFHYPQSIPVGGQSPSATPRATRGSWHA